MSIGTVTITHKKSFKKTMAQLRCKERSFVLCYSSLDFSPTEPLCPVAFLIKGLISDEVSESESERNCK